MTARLPASVSAPGPSDLHLIAGMRFARWPAVAAYVVISIMLVANVSPARGGFATATPVPRSDPGSGPTPTTSHVDSGRGNQLAESVHRLAAVSLDPGRPGYLSGRGAWLAYDSADELFFVAVPPQSVEVVPGDFGYDPVVMATIPVGAAPFGVAYDNVTGDVFVANSLSANVSVIAGSTLRLVATIAVGSGPMGVAFDPVTREVYVSNNGSNTVSIISDTKLAVVATVAVGAEPIGVAADPSSGDVFVANHGSSNLSVISGTTGRVVANVALPSGPYGVAIDPRLGRAFVTDQGASNVSAISDSTYAVLANISIPHDPGCCSLSLEGLAYDTGDGLLYVGAGLGTVVVIQPANDSLLVELNFDPAGVAYDPQTGDVCVTNTANATFECAVFYHPAAGGPYTIQLSETGLPPGTLWYASVDSEQAQSNGTSMSFSMPNGSFPFSVEPSYPSAYTYHADPSSGLVTVDGGNVTVSIAFSTGSYIIDVVEAGLPAGTLWTAEFGSNLASSTTNTNWFNVSNGTYELALGEVLNYSGSPITRSVTVNGSPLTVNVTYSGAIYPKYALTFTEAGLAPGTTWNVTLGGTTDATSGSSLVLNESNGTYTFGVAATGYAANPATGVITVHGSPANRSIVFTSTVVWQIVFRETGLPTGSDWGVLIGSEAQSATSQDLTFTRLNGSYGYLVLPVAGYVASSPGTVTVNGSDQVVPVAFHPQVYPIVFIELGLPLGTNWSVTVTDNTTGYNQTQKSTTSSIIFFLPNGTYTVTFTLPSGYNGTASATSITVAGRAGAGATVSVGVPPGPSAPTLGAGQTDLVLALVVAVLGLLGILVVVLLSRRPPRDANRLAP